jgi:DNA-binding transcriptional LysR family regulator
MEMPQIRYFLALSEELNFTRAAKQCGVSQPSLTNGIIELERRFGGALFRRKSGGRAHRARPRKFGLT